MNDDRPSLTERKRLVLAKVPIGQVVEQHVKLSGSEASKNRRGRCPFHSGSSASFSVKSASGSDPGFAHCFGCTFHGNVIDFIMAIKGWSFIDALVDLEALIGVHHDARSPRVAGAPLVLERKPRPRSSREWRGVEGLEAGRWMWKRARRDHAAVRRYFLGRGIPDAMLGDDRLTDFRYLAECPAVLWEEGSDPRKVIHNPAVIALVRKPVEFESGRVEFVPVGVHVTYLDPDGSSTMTRRKPWAKQLPDGSWPKDCWLPKRRMLGPVGGAGVLLGTYRPEARLWLGEGNETVLSGMALGEVGDDDVGIATLSLDNLQGVPRLWRNRTWPLHAIVPERPGYLIPGHRGPVIGLVDSDMAPLKGMQDAGEWVVERKGGPLVQRWITGAERARICGELFVKVWRGIGCPAEAMRAPAGMDFNDVVREVA